MHARNNFDLIRLVAAGQVVLAHAIAHLQLKVPTAVQQVVDFFPGVAIFFVVSGFLIADSYSRQRSLRTYFISRALRIFPALWVNLVLITLLLAWDGSLALSAARLKFWLWHVIAFFLGSDYLATTVVAPIFNGEGRFPFYPSGVLWTLPVELSYYLLVPLILARSLASRRLSGTSLALWGVASLACFFLVSRAEWPVFIGLYLWVFLLGAAARCYWHQLEALFVKKAGYWLCGFLAFSLLFQQLFGFAPNYTSPRWSNVLHTALLASTTLSCAYSLPGLAIRLLKGRDISYGLYLWHMPVFCVFMVYDLKGWIPAAVAAAIALALAGLSRRFVEEPALALKDTLQQPRAVQRGQDSTSASRLDRS